jgi:hypothetical protein
LTTQIYSCPTGLVWIRDFDQGVVETMGGVVLNTPECKLKNNYYVTIPGVDPALVPVVFNNPEQILESKILPFIHVSRDSIDPARQRWHSDGAKEYVAGVPGTETVINGVSGFGSVEYKNQAWPFDITYRITVFARFEREALTMLRFILKKYQVIGLVWVKDSKQEYRSYTTYLESSINDLSEIVDVADRTKAYAITIRVEAELDLHDPIISETVFDFQINV